MDQVPQARGAELNGGVAGLFRADTDRFLDGKNENFAVADFSGFGGLDDGVCGFGHVFVSDNDFDFDLRKKIHGVFAAAINLGVSFLTTEAFDFRDGHALNANFGECLFDMLHFEGFNDGFDFLHDMRVLNDRTGKASREKSLMPVVVAS
jgi:hypothetical protein